jgi:hypothetical protein
MNKRYHPSREVANNLAYGASFVYLFSLLALTFLEVTFLGVLMQQIIVRFASLPLRVSEKTV